MLAQNQKKKNNLVSYTGQTIIENPETSNSGETGTFYKDNYIISAEPPFIINTLQLVKSGNEENEKVDEEAVEILESKNYQAVLAPLSV